MKFLSSVEAADRRRTNTTTQVEIIIKYVKQRAKEPWKIRRDVTQMLCRSFRIPPQSAHSHFFSPPPLFTIARFSAFLLVMSFTAAQTLRVIRAARLCDDFILKFVQLVRLFCMFLSKYRARETRKVCSRFKVKRNHEVRFEEAFRKS